MTDDSHPARRGGGPLSEDADATAQVVHHATGPGPVPSAEVPAQHPGEAQHHSAAPTYPRDPATPGGGPGAVAATDHGSATPTSGAYGPFQGGGNAGMPMSYESQPTSGPTGVTPGSDPVGPADVTPGGSPAGLPYGAPGPVYGSPGSGAPVYNTGPTYEEPPSWQTPEHSSPTSGAAHPHTPISGTGAGAGPVSGAGTGAGAGPLSGVGTGAGPTFGAGPISGAGAGAGAGAGFTFGPGPTSGAGAGPTSSPPSWSATDPISGSTPTPDPFGFPYSPGPRIEPTPKPPKSHTLIPALAGLLAGLVIFGTGGWFLGTSTSTTPDPVTPPQASAPASAPAALPPYEQNQVAINQPKFTGPLPPVAQGWLPHLSGCSRSGEKGGPTLAKGEKSRVRCEMDAMSVIFVEYRTVADRDKARVKTLGQNVDARTLTPGVGEAVPQRATPSGRVNGNYVEYAYQTSGRTVSGIWWDDSATPVAAYLLAYWKEGTGQKWEPMRDVWTRYA